MSSVMTYRGLSACVDYDDEDGYSWGESRELRTAWGFTRNP